MATLVAFFLPHRLTLHPKLERCHIIQHYEWVSHIKESCFGFSLSVSFPAVFPQVGLALQGGESSIHLSSVIWSVTQMLSEIALSLALSLKFAGHPC